MSLADRVRVNENNREPRQPLVLLVDTSGSMTDDLPEVIEGLRALQEAVRADPVARNRIEIALVTFGGTVQLHGDFGEISAFELPQLTADGQTPMASALQQALDLVDSKKKAYRTSGLDYFRPWIFLVTDGEPTDLNNWPQAAEAVRRAEQERRIALFAVGTASANFDRLKELCPVERPPLRLRENQWAAMFTWLSRSVQAKSRSRPGEEVVAENPTGANGWATLP